MTTDVARYVKVQASSAAPRGPVVAGQVIEARPLGRDVIPRNQAALPARPVPSLIAPRRRSTVLVAVASTAPAATGLAFAGSRLVEAVAAQPWAAPAGAGLAGIPVVLVVGWLHTRRIRRSGGGAR